MFQLILLLAVPFLIAAAQRAQTPLRPWHSLALPTSTIAGASTAFFWGSWALVLPVVLSCTLGLVLPRLRCFGWFLVAAMAVSGGSYLWQLHNHQKLARLLSEKPHTVHAIVSDIITWQSKKKGCVVTLEVTHVSYEPIRCRVRCYLYSPTNLEVGNNICLYCFQTKAPQDKQHLLSYAIRDNIVGSFFGPFLRFKKLSFCAPSYEWYQRWYTYRKGVYEKLEHTIPAKTFAAFSTLFLGNKNVPNYPAMRRLFAAWGLTHYLARSGLHIALIIMLWSILLLAVPLPFLPRKLLLLLLLVIYSALSWSSISFVRALLLWIFYITGSLLSRPAAPLHLISLIACGILLCNPAYLFCLDFQLSFFLSAVLMVINHSKRQQFLLASCETLPN